MESLFGPGNKIIHTDEKIEEELWTTFFQATHIQSNRINFNQNFYDLILTTYEEILQEDPGELSDVYIGNINSEITLTEINLAIKATRVEETKSFDNDNHHSVMLRKFGPKALMLIDHLFNLSLKKMIWPWITADVVFQKKQGKPTYSKPGSYRPITISSTNKHMPLHRLRKGI